MTQPLLLGLAMALVDDLAREDAKRDRLAILTPLGSVPTPLQARPCPAYPLLLQSISPQQHQPDHLQPTSGNQNADI